MQRTWDTIYSEATYTQLSRALDNARKLSEQVAQRKRDQQDELDMQRMAYEQG